MTGYQKQSNLIKKIIAVSTALILSVMFLLPLKASAVANPYYGGNSNCTWTAWQLAYERLGIALPGWGNAGTWYNSAAAYGYSVGRSPAPNSIMVLSGHVAFVAQVSGNDLYVMEGGYLGEYHEDWESMATGYVLGQRLIGFIYLGGLPVQKPEPTPAPVTPQQPEPQKQEPKQEQPKQQENKKEETKPSPIADSDKTGKQTSSEKEKQTEKSTDVLPKQATAENSEAVEKERLKKLEALKIRKAELEKSITLLEEKLDTGTEDLNEKINKYKDRLHGLYISGFDSMIEWIFTADSFNDFLYKFDQMSNVLREDLKMITDLSSTINDTETTKKALEIQRAELDEIYI